MQHIVEKAQELRQLMRQRSDIHTNEVMSQRNKQRQQKTFKEGDVVMQRQTQVAVGPHSSIQPKFVGPFAIMQITDRNSSALIRNMKTKRVSKSHFSWLQHYKFDPKSNRLPHNFEDQLEDLTPSEYSQRLISPPPSQPQPDNEDGADDADFMDDSQMFHSTKSKQSRHRRQLSQNTQTQQTQTTPQDEPVINDSSPQTQQPNQLDSQMIEEDDIADTHFDDNQFDFDDQGFDSTPSDQFKPYTQVHQPTPSDNTQDHTSQIQPQDTTQLTTIPETQLDTQTPSQDTPSQIEPSQQMVIRKKQPKLISQPPASLQPIVDIIDDRNKRTSVTFIDDEILQTQPRQTGSQHSQPTPQFQPLQPLQDELSSQSQPQQPRRILRIQYIPDEPQIQIVDRINRQPRPRPRPRHRPNPPRPRAAHRYPTRSKDK
jgi:hypothetical protein